MSAKINRYVSNQAGSFTKTGINKFDIDIPASVGFTDLHNSCLVLRMKITDDTEGLYPFTFVQLNDDLMHEDVQGPQSLIRNAKVTSDRYGVLNEQLRQNVVGANMDWMRTGRAQQDANCTFGHTWSGSGYGIDRSSGLGQSPFLLTQGSRVTAQGVQNAIDKPAVPTVPEIRIPLRHLDRLADGNRQFPNLAVGNLRYHVELENELDVVGCPASDQERGVVQELADATCDGNGDVAFWEYNGTDGQTVYFNDPILYCNIPIYVGCPILLSYLDENNTPLSLTTNVTSMYIDDAGKLKFSIDQQPGLPGEDLHACHFTFIEPVNPRWEIIEASIELVELQLTKAQLASATKSLENLSIPFYDYDVVVQQCTQTSDYNQILQAPPNTVACVAIVPAMDGLVSKLGDALSYRYSIDGLNTTDRDVVVSPISAGGRQLHHHRLIQTLSNMGLTLRRFDAGNLTAADTTNKGDHVVYPQILPMLPKMQTVQFRLRANPNKTIPNTNVFNVFVISRQLVINKSGVMIQ